MHRFVKAGELLVMFRNYLVLSVVLVCLFFVMSVQADTVLLSELSRAQKNQRTSLSLETPDVGDRILASIGDFPNLARLSLAGSKVTDKGLVHLEDLQLKRLNLNRTSVGDAGLQHISRISVLEELYLGGSRVSSSGIRALSALSHLRILALHGTRVDDSALSVLKEMKSLRKLYLGWTFVTRQGVQELKRARPRLRISGMEHRITDRGITRWLKEYHRSPRPEIALPIFVALRQKGFVVGGLSQAFLQGAISGFLDLDPKSVDFLFLAGEPRSKEETVFLHGVVQKLENPMSQEQVLSFCSEDRPAWRAVCVDAQRKRNLGKNDIASVEDLDFLWGRFSVSGDAKYVMQVISLATPVEAGPSETVPVSKHLQRTAESSLAEQAVLHERVREICMLAIKDSSENSREFLRRVLHKAESKNDFLTNLRKLGFGVDDQLRVVGIVSDDARRIAEPLAALSKQPNDLGLVTQIRPGERFYIAFIVGGYQSGHDQNYRLTLKWKFLGPDGRKIVSQSNRARGPSRNRMDPPVVALHPKIPFVLTDSDPSGVYTFQVKVEDSNSGLSTKNSVSVKYDGPSVYAK